MRSTCLRPEPVKIVFTRSACELVHHFENGEVRRNASSGSTHDTERAADVGIDESAGLQEARRDRIYGGPYLPPPPELTPLSPNSTPLSPETPPSSRGEWSATLSLHSPLELGVSGESGVELGESGVSSGGGGRYGPPYE